MYEAHMGDGSLAFTAYEQRACVPVDGERGMEKPDDLREAKAEPVDDV